MSGLEVVAALAAVVSIVGSASRHVFRQFSSIIFFTKYYGSTGLILCLFGNSEIWRVQVQVLQNTNEADVMNFKKAVQDECSILAIAVSERCLIQPETNKLIDFRVLL